MSDRPKSHFLEANVHAYLVAHGTPPDALLSELCEETKSAVGPLALMQVAPEQGAFLTVLTRLLGARRAIEVGTFTGYSAICIARGLPKDGKLLCLDFSEEWTAIARETWAEAGLEDRIELQLGPAAETLAAVAPENQFDLAFIDADKASYETYIDLVHARLRPGGVVLVDNVLARGTVVDDESQDENTRAICAFNDARVEDERWDRVMLPISDGLTLLRKR
jgi:caffeoyl-CoA O-methyltransferase